MCVCLCVFDVGGVVVLLSDGGPTATGKPCCLQQNEQEVAPEMNYGYCTAKARFHIQG